MHTRLTVAQYEEVRANAARRGFSSMAAYSRYAMVELERGMYDRIVEIHKAVSRLEEAAEKWIR